VSSERSRELKSILWIGAGAFLLAAMATYREELLVDEPGGFRNVCGNFGRLLAGNLLGLLGYAAFLLPIAFLGEGVRLLRRIEARPLALRAAAVVVFMPVLAAVLHDLLGGRSEWIPDPGGEAGIALKDLLTRQSGLGLLGGRIALTVLLLVTFVLYADLLYTRSAAAALRWIEGKGGLAAVLPWNTNGRAPAAGSKGRRRSVEGAAPAGDLPEVEESAPSNAELDAELERALERADDVAEPLEAEEVPAQKKRPLLEKLVGRMRPRRDAEVGAKAGAGGAAIPLAVPARKPPPMIEAEAALTPEAPKLAAARPYGFPPLQLLDPPERSAGVDLLKFTETAARKLTAALRSFKVEARVVGVQHGPSITMLEVELAAGTKLTRLRALEDDLAMALAAQGVRIVAPIPGKSTAGIEIPNETREIVQISELLQWQGWNPQKYAIPIFLGKDSGGAPRVEDLAKMPHLLVAGSTGSGKSVCLNTLIMSILFTRTPEQVKLILIDPKMVELSAFQNVPHLMCPVVTDMKRAEGILEWAVGKMEERYALLHRAGVRNIYAFNKLGDAEVRKRLGDEVPPDLETPLPFIVIVMDEMADLMLAHGKDVEESITRLAQKSRAVGIHVILATQRPSTNVITGLIKANLPTRIAFRVTSKIDSRVILDQNGADKLLGQGDMLYVPPGSADLSRVQGSFVSDQEIKDVVTFLAEQGAPQYSRELIQRRATSDEDPAEIDDLYDEAARFVVETQRGSASLLQRRFAIGYTRASRLIDLMAADGILGEFKGSQAREVLCAGLEELETRRSEQKRERGVEEAAPKGAAASEAREDQEPTLHQEEEA
jgi:DNA segregation ATPase FtsK/SpoIIIE-like protein